MSAHARKARKEAPMLRYERALWRAGTSRVAGVDEAGRGPLAGPVTAACVVLPKRVPRALDGLTDSKKLSEARREHYFALLQEVALAIGVGRASAEEIDRINILQATFVAMRRALDAIATPEHVLVDGNLLIPELEWPQQAIIGGDGLSLSIAAASVIAKVTRDREMHALDAQYPGYGFARHKGYGTPAHREALDRLGPCHEHRRSFLKRHFAVI
ncbi:MAG TPA: ribonuclease HII [Oscillatoriaceae cyanobacterium]